MSCVTKYGGRAIVKDISYLSDFSNGIFTEGDTKEKVEQYVEQHIDEIFFTKSKDWEYENELRILVKGNKRQEVLNLEHGVFSAVILCLPKVDRLTDAVEYKILKVLCKDLPILHYTTQLGNKELLNEKNEPVCDKIGVDWQIDAESLAQLAASEQTK